ncbi:MAG TPA: hypothetical protein PLG43_10305 [Spirochaetia bacterium]|nr:hypothetical protein [Spirochaetia bacterium]
MNGSGINERINIDIRPYDNNYAGAYKVRKIGIINGYATNSDLFINNNRVKRMRIEYENSLYYEGNPFNIKESDSFTFDLQDTMEMQYIESKEPLFMSEIIFTILDVYKGKKWDDTCISEIDIITD